MEKEQNFSSAGFQGKFLVASLLILSGILLLARHTGWISAELFDMLVAWHSLLIISGIYATAHRHYINGIALILCGTYILLGKLACVPEDSQAVIWPVALILAGILLFVKTRKSGCRRNKHGSFHRSHCGHSATGADNFDEQQCESDNGFLHSDSVFNGVRHVVLEDIFRGAAIHTFFGGTIIDLRHTNLAPGETYIDVDCNCGGIELLVPPDWKVVNKCNAFFGGYDDKRWQQVDNRSINQESVLVIRGQLTVSGLEIKS